MRVEQWEARLAEVIDNVRDEPLVWGVHDCFTFINACHFALKDTLLAEEWMGDYENGLQAKLFYHKKLRDTGHANIIAAMDYKLSRDASRSRGSIVARPLADDGVFGYAFGCVVSDKIAFLTLNGLDFVTAEEGDIFWSVE